MSVSSTLPTGHSKSLDSVQLKKQLTDAGIPVEAIVKKLAKLPDGKKNFSKAISGITQEKIFVRTKIKDSEIAWQKVSGGNSGIMDEAMKRLSSIAIINRR